MGLNFISKVFLVVCAALYTNAHIDHQTNNVNYKLITHLVDANNIEFQLTVTTTGWVGVGVNSNPNMIAADLCIITKDPANDTIAIIKDYHGNATNSEPIEDTKQESDWTVSHFVATAATRTIHVRRLLKTTDENQGQDIEITKEPIHIVWAYGTTDVFGEHAARGAVAKANLQTEETGGGGGASDIKGPIAFILGTLLLALAKIL